MRQELRLRVLIPIAVIAVFGLGYGAFAFTGTPSEEPVPPPQAASTQPAGTNTAPAAPKVTRAQWRKQANAVCAGLTAEVSALGQPSKPEDLAKVLPDALAAADRALTGLRGLQPAKRDAKRVARMTGDFATFVALEKQATAALSQQNLARFVTLNARAFKANDHGSAIARKLGAKACAAGSSRDSKLQRALDAHRVVVAVLYSPGADLDTQTIREARAGADTAGAGFVAVNAADTRSAALLAKSYGVRTPPAVLVFVAGRGAVATFTSYVDRATVAQAVDNAAL